MPKAEVASRSGGIAVSAPAEKEKRGPRGLGSVYERTINGVRYYEASRSITTIDPDTGKPRRRRITATAARKADAINALQAKLNPQVLSESAKPRVSAKLQMTYASWFETWISEIPEWKVSDIVRHKYKRMGEQYLIPALGHRRITEIDREDIQNLIHRDLMGREELSEATVRNIYRVCSMSFRAAVETKRVAITDNPCTGVRTPKRNDYIPSISKEIGIAKGLIKWMHDTQHPDEVRFLFQFLGLRRSERIAISWSNVKYLHHPERAKIVINQQIARRQDGGEWYLKPPKTEKGIREIPLVEPFRSALIELERKQQVQRLFAEGEGHVWGGPDGRFADLVFLTPTGGLIRPNQDNADWHKLMAEYTNGEHSWRGHLSRHITATLLAEAGVNVATARSVLGHASDAMTYYYTHLSNESKRPAMDALATTLTERMRPRS